MIRTDFFLSAAQKKAAIAEEFPFEPSTIFQILKVCKKEEDSWTKEDQS